MIHSVEKRQGGSGRPGKRLLQQASRRCSGLGEEPEGPPEEVSRGSAGHEEGWVAEGRRGDERERGSTPGKSTAQTAGPGMALGETGWRSWCRGRNQTFGVKLRGAEHPALPELTPATMASRSPSRFGRIRTNSCRRKGATSVLLFTNIRTGFFKETDARSFTCQPQRQGS